jgi:hypothetical protein
MKKTTLECLSTGRCGTDDDDEEVHISVKTEANLLLFLRRECRLTSVGCDADKNFCQLADFDENLD